MKGVYMKAKTLFQDKNIKLLEIDNTRCFLQVKIKTLKHLSGYYSTYNAWKTVDSIVKTYEE